MSFRLMFFTDNVKHQIYRIIQRLKRRRPFRVVFNLIIDSSHILAQISLVARLRVASTAIKDGA